MQLATVWTAYGVFALVMALVSAIHGEDAETVLRDVVTAVVFLHLALAFVVAWPTERLQRIVFATSYISVLAAGLTVAAWSFC